MKTSYPFAVAVAFFVAVATGGTPAVEATIEGTCQTAAAADKRVDVRYCIKQFAMYHGAAEADAWGLAKIAALIGVNLGDDAVYDIGNKIRPPGGAKAKAAMDTCAKAYDAVGLAFAEATDELGSRRYAAAKQKMAKVAALTQRCEGAFAKAGARSPLAAYSRECQQMAIIGIAITNLVK